jgi:hypothetical protein
MRSIVERSVAVKVGISKAIWRGVPRYMFRFAIMRLPHSWRTRATSISLPDASASFSSASESVHQHAAGCFRPNTGEGLKAREKALYPPARHNHNMGEKPMGEPGKVKARFRRADATPAAIIPGVSPTIACSWEAPVPIRSPTTTSLVAMPTRVCRQERGRLTCVRSVPPRVLRVHTPRAQVIRSRWSFRKISEAGSVRLLL